MYGPSPKAAVESRVRRHQDDLTGHQTGSSASTLCSARPWWLNGWNRTDRLPLAISRDTGPALASPSRCRGGECGG